ncbi:hypothetical protein [Arthrobacter flavus]|uniref:Uncharacterized protein n=1 Tax=Arthrobacter flavus TaxID=95172 RepID=A0ABW4Q9U3_9MICC
MNHMTSLSGSNLMGSTQKLTSQMGQDIQLDLHALLGVTIVLIDGEKSQWPHRSKKNGREYTERFTGAVETLAKPSDDFDLFRGIRNYAQHFAEVPFTVIQISDQGTALTRVELHLQAQKMKGYSKWSDRQKATLQKDVRGPDLIVTLQGTYRCLDSIDVLNRELLLELFANHCAAVRDVTEAAAPKTDEWPWLIELDSSGDAKGHWQLVAPADQLLLESLAGLPATHPILFPRVARPGFWLQGPQLPSSRPHLPPGTLAFSDQGIADWATDIVQSPSWN